MPQTYFTSDTHAGHANIIRYSNRPFKDVDEMNWAMIEGINRKVRAEDTLYHLGDVAMGGSNYVEWFRERINCRNIHLIYGNHDKQIRKSSLLRSLFKSCQDFLEIKVGNEGQNITLCHYALIVWNKSHHMSWSLFGHSHGSLPDNPNSLSFDVGVDCHNYQPLSFAEVAAIMSRKIYKPIDHHVGDSNE